MFVSVRPTAFLTQPSHSHTDRTGVRDGACGTGRVGEAGRAMEAERADRRGIRERARSQPPSAEVVELATRKKEHRTTPTASKARTSTIRNIDFTADVRRAARISR